MTGSQASFIMMLGILKILHRFRVWRPRLLAITILKENNFINSEYLSILLENEIYFFSTPSVIVVNNPYFNSKEFGHYLAGYIEGDGTRRTASTLKAPIGSKKECSFQIVFHISDLEFVKYLRKRIGHGNIYFAKNSNSVRLMIQNLQGVLYIINLINGKMRTPKINALYTMIDWLNKYKLKKENYLIKLPLDLSPISSNSW
jgi:hypothetical protein